MARKIVRREVAVVVGLALASSVGLGTALAHQKKTYKYRCPKCKLIQEYGTMGTKKCPNDGATMIRMQ